MPLPRLYAHPFSSYCQKVLVALYENGTPFEYRSLEDPQAKAELAAHWPLQRFPIWVESGRTVLESTCIVEYLGQHHPGAVELIPADPAQALDVRMLDRFFDNYVSTPLQSVVFNALRPVDARDAYGERQARQALDAAYDWLDQHMARRTWAAADRFSLADCAAAPALFYADWAHPIAARHRHVHAYRQRLLERPSFARAVDEARPFRHYFPLGAPERD